MKKILFLLALSSSIHSITASTNTTFLLTEISQDSLRITELDKYWSELSKTVREGEFEAYEAGYHPDAVVVFATGKNKTSVPLAKALAGWKQGFIDTKEGKNKSDVEFRFSQRIGDATTAHETGIFNYWSSDSNGKNKVLHIIHFEMLLVKQNGKWVGIMEHQKHRATQEEWDNLNK